METGARILRVCKALAILTVLGAGGVRAATVEESRKALQFESHSAYLAGQEIKPQGVIDPYTGRFVDIDAFVASDYTAPRRSFAYAKQGSAAGSGLSYQVTDGIALNFDPAERRINTDLNLGGSEKKRLKLRVTGKSAKVVFSYKF